MDDSTRNPRHLQLLDERLAQVELGEIDRLLVVMPPQEGKSERTSHYGALWMLLANPDLRIVIASYEAETARRWGAKIRDDLVAFDLPVSLKEDQRAAGRWQVDGHRGGVYCVGVGGALTGRPVDVLFIDDPVKDREQADSQTYRDRVWNWWTDVATTRLAPGGRVVLIQTRWHEDDLAGRVLASEGAADWTVLHVAAQAELPSEAYPEPDPLERPVGELLPSAREWPQGRWAKVRRDVGLRTWNALYQGKPSATEGSVWLRRWWARFDVPVWTEINGSCYVPEGGLLVQSWDMAFKDLKTSDFVVGQVWWLWDGRAHLVDQVRDRLDFPSTCRALEALTRRWPQAVAKLVEDKANGPAVIATLKGRVPGLIPIEPSGGKEARAAACAPLIEAGNVWVPLPAVLPAGADFIEEAASFPTGTNDDMVDAASQALAWLFDFEGKRRPRSRIIS